LKSNPLLREVLKYLETYSSYSSNDFYTAPSNLSRASISESTSKIKDDLETIEHIIISENKIPHGIYQTNDSQNEHRKSPTESEMSFHLPEQ
jgi:hypothetical protein